MFNRFVSNIFFYKNRKRQGNVGFIKVLADEGKVNLEIKVRGVSSSNKIFKVKLLLNDGERLFLDETGLLGQNITYSQIFNTEDINDSGRKFSEVIGLVIENTDDDALFASVWIEHEDEQCIFNSSVENDTESEIIMESVCDNESVPVAELSIERIFSEYGNKDIIDAFNDDEFYDCIEIEPLVISRLPKEFEALSHNSFLMHGYARFHHLLLGRLSDYNDRFFLGVPGVLTKSENAIANMYGFHKFKSSHRSDVHMCCFGYWYVIISA